MADNPDRCESSGSGPNSLTVISHTNAPGPNDERIAAVAERLGRGPQGVDDLGYEWDIMAATATPEGIAYVERRERERGRYVDVKIRLHYASADREDAWDLQSYNPYFGARVHYMEWWDEGLLLIYSEKHDTYACFLEPGLDPKFVEIDDWWQINRGKLAFVKYKESVVTLLALPRLDLLESIDSEAARGLGLMPEVDW